MKISIQKGQLSKYFTLLKEINHFIQKRCLKLIKCYSKYLHYITKKSIF